MRPASQLQADLDQSNRGDAPLPTAVERYGVLSILAVILVVNVLTADLYPVVWLDEVMFTDPVASYHMGQGFHSTAWRGQARSEDTVVDRPLYVAFLLPWMGIFGFGLLTVRSLGHVLGAALTFVVWWAVARLGLLTRAASRVLLVLLLSCGSGLAFVQRSGRPDTVSMIPVALALMAFSLRSPRSRALALALSGVLVPFAGVHVVSFMTLAALLLLLFIGTRIVRPLATVGLGVLIGLVAGGAFLWHEGLLARYLAVSALSPESILHGVAATRPLSLLESSLERGSAYPDAVYVDPSSVALLVGGLTVLAYLAMKRRLPLRGWLVFGVLAGVWIPTLEAALGKYPLYYAWMGFLPMSIAVLRAREQLGSALLRHTLAVAVAAAIGIGLPAQLAIAIRDREVRSYRLVEALVERTVGRGSWVYCDYACYYAAKSRAEEVFTPAYNASLTDAERRRMDAVIVRTGNTVIWETIDPRLAASWEPTSQGVAVQRRGTDLLRSHWRYSDYASLRVYRRRGPAGGGQTPGPAGVSEGTGPTR